MSKVLNVLLPIALAMTAIHVQATETAGSSDAGSASSSGSSGDVMSTGEVKCLLEKIGVDSHMAESTATNVTEALKLMKFDSAEFTRTSLLHFLAQIHAESTSGKNMTEKAPKSASRTGFGYIQVTGKRNLRSAEQCMNEVSPGSGTGVSTSPNDTIGANGDPLKAALASLCWWRTNIVDNDRHVQISKDSSRSSDKMITEIVNAGHIGGRVTRGAQNISERQDTFSELQAGETQCRQYTI